jgi:hypothetical protein
MVLLYYCRGATQTIMDDACGCMPAGDWKLAHAVQVHSTLLWRITDKKAWGVTVAIHQPPAAPHNSTTAPQLQKSNQQITTV